MNLVAEKFEAVVVPDSAQRLSFEGTLTVTKGAAKEPEPKMPQHPCRCCQPVEAFPLEVVKPDTVRYRSPNGQTVEITLSRMPFRLLEFVMGQEGMTEDMVTIAAVVWNATYDCTNAIDKAKGKVNRALAKAKIPFRLFQINKCISLKKQEGGD